MAPVTRRREEKQMEEEEEEVKGPYAVVLKKDPFGRVCVCAVRGLVGRSVGETHNEKNKSVVRHERKKRWKE